MPTLTGDRRRTAVSAFLPPILGLILGAGLALTGCGEDSATTPAPAPAPAPSPPPAPDPVGVPGGLTATAGMDFLEFRWEAVEGATGYEIQMSMKEGDFSEVVTAMVTETMHRFTVAPETTGYARVRAHEGDRQGDWSEAAMGMSLAAPLMLGTPMPMVSDTGPDYIEWSWAPVADAAGYLVNVAATMEGLDTARIQFAPQPMHREAGVEAETEMVIRVRATGGEREDPVVGAWSEAVSGMSDAAPMPFMVSMRPPEAGADNACSGQAFCPDDGTDPKTALASANPALLVSASHPARISPMFVDGPPPVTIGAGESATPFRRVSGWNALQSAVVGEGAVFRFERITLGAGQEAAPTGDTMYITCGPFACSEAAGEAPEAPEITADAVCEEFEADFRLVKGIALNRSATDKYNGVDVGWLYTISHPAEVTHEFTTIPTHTGSLEVPGGTVKATRTETPLVMKAGSGTSKVNKFGGPDNRDGDQTTADDPGPIRNGFDANGMSQDCAPLTGLGNYETSYERMALSLSKSRGEADKLERPPNCFRLMTDAVYATIVAVTEADVSWFDYVPGYQLHIDPQSVVSWAGSRVAWGDDDPFEDLECERVTFEAQDQLDVCSEFQEEAEAFWGKGLDGGQFRPEYNLGATDENDPSTYQLFDISIRNKAPVPASQASGGEYRPAGSRHAHMYLVNKEKGTYGSGGNGGVDGTVRDHDLYRVAGTQGARSSDTQWRAIVTVSNFDGDGDPRFGDLGKIDLGRFVGGTSWLWGRSDGIPDNYDLTADPDLACTDDDGGEGCDVVVEIPFSATLTRIADTDTCTYTIEASMTCTWDANGDDHRGGNTDVDSTVTNDNRFITCLPN